MRVLLADDHAQFRASMRRMLESAGLEVCAEAEDAHGTLTAAHEYRPDVVLLDVNMPGSGLRALERLTEELPATPVVMLTIRDDDYALLAAIRGGAKGYLLKDSDPSQLPELLRDAVAGRSILAGRAVDGLIGYVRGDRRLISTSGSAVRLTEWEWDILSRLRDGRTAAEIAFEFDVEAVTIDRHVATILEKLQVSTREDALALMERPAD